MPTPKYRRSHRVHLISDDDAGRTACGEPTDYLIKVDDDYLRTTCLRCKRTQKALGGRTTMGAGGVASSRSLIARHGSSTSSPCIRALSGGSISTFADNYSRDRNGDAMDGCSVPMGEFCGCVWRDWDNPITGEHERVRYECPMHRADNPAAWFLNNSQTWLGQPNDPQGQRRIIAGHTDRLLHGLYWLLKGETH